jgi:hypothetical protein
MSTAAADNTFFNGPLMSGFKMSTDYADYVRPVQLSRRHPASPRHPQITRIHNLRNLRNSRTLCTGFYNGPQITQITFIPLSRHAPISRKPAQFTNHAKRNLC